ncbi:ABC transporter ATP-binding protein [Qipengyuania gaetbuli]|uniref:ABC transporter ATP-binding protein n=1 Tax=Qipengyuania gaetbuli TaxID=266952 RepID=UPI001CD3F29E|nr:ABC transporter ATP-binding protein [Qipengyuania gaetbuli]MCA0908987.1 ABC transporter ATP-binding protein [Qipengyuania gaetbuli]
MRLVAKELALEGRLAGVDCTLEAGAITAICGPNGAGKSSLLEALAGLLSLDGGTVDLDGESLATLPPRERAKRLGYLPQGHEIAWDVPVRRLVELGRMPHGDRLAGPVDAALDALDITGLADRRAQSLSGGETARVLLARVLAGEPRWILADEPLAALDIAHQLELLRHLRAEADRGTGVVLVLHDLAHAMNHADRVIVLDEGHIAADGPPQQALSPERVAQCWRVAVKWIGEDGARALVAA